VGASYRPVSTYWPVSKEQVWQASLDFHHFSTYLTKSENFSNPGESKDSQSSEGWLAQEQDFIETFFERKVPQVLAKEGTHCTAASWDQFAKTVLQSNDIRPVDNQGAQSYTLICHSKNKVIQFRPHCFDEDVLALAHKIYGELVLAPTLIHGFSLPLYTCPVMPGIIHIFQRFPDKAFPLDRQLNTIRDLALFVSKAAFWPQPRDSLSSDSWTITAGTKLTRLA
jgi:hypothetical protein